MLNVKFHICPVCGNVIVSTGNAEVKCCGKTVPALRADISQGTTVETQGNEYVIPIHPPRTKDHYFMK